MIQTKLHSRMGMGEEAYDKFLGHNKQIHPLGRSGTPEEVARAIAF